MNTNPLKQGALTENSAGIGTVTRKMVRERAVELAVVDGRPAEGVSKSDLEQAKRQLTGQPDMEPKEALLESAPESERWDPVPGSTGHKVSAAPARTRMKKGEAITKGWWMKASPRRNSTRRSKLSPRRKWTATSGLAP